MSQHKPQRPNWQYQASMLLWVMSSARFHCVLRWWVLKQYEPLAIRRTITVLTHNVHILHFQNRHPTLKIVAFFGNRVLLTVSTVWTLRSCTVYVVTVSYFSVKNKTIYSNKHTSQCRHRSSFLPGTSEPWSHSFDPGLALSGQPLISIHSWKTI